MSVFTLTHKTFGKICEVEVFCSRCNPYKEDTDWFIDLHSWFSVPNYSNFLVSYIKDLEFKFDNELDIQNNIDNFIGNFNVLQNLRFDFNEGNGIFGIKIKCYDLSDERLNKDKNTVIEYVRRLFKQLAEIYNLNWNED